MCWLVGTRLNQPYIFTGLYFDVVYLDAYKPGLIIQLSQGTVWGEGLIITWKKELQHSPNA